MKIIGFIIVGFIGRQAFAQFAYNPYEFSSCQCTKNVFDEYQRSAKDILECTQNAKLLSDGLKSTQDAKKKFAQSMKESRVLIFGETHYLSSRTPYPELLETLKKSEPSLDCLFIEASSSFINVFEYDYVGGQGMSLVIEKAKSLGLKIIPVDSANGKNENIRNEAMAQNILNHLNGADRCRKSIFIVGNDHLKGKKETNLVSIPRLLKDKKIKVTSFHFIQNKTSVIVQSWGAPQLQIRPEIDSGIFQNEFCSTVPNFNRKIVFSADKEKDFEYYFLFPGNY